MTSSPLIGLLDNLYYPFPLPLQSTLSSSSLIFIGTYKIKEENALVKAIMEYSPRIKYNYLTRSKGDNDDFHNYGILSMSQTPEIEVHIVKSNAKLGGVGEPGVPPAGPSVANAVFAATGIRVRRLPMKPETVVSIIKKERRGNRYGTIQ